jgi:DNA adenine methylase
MPLAPSRFDRFVEPFAGGASFLLALQPPVAVLNDANAELIEMYLSVRDEPHELMAALDDLQPYVLEEGAYYSIRAVDTKDMTRAEKAARLIFLNKAGFNGLYRVNREGKFNVPFGSHSRPPSLYDRENLLGVSALLQSTEVMCVDFEELLDRVGHGDFVYVDPPYAPVAPTANFTSYTPGSFTLADQRRLAESVRRAMKRGASVLVSNSATAVVRELYSGFEFHPIRARRYINSDGTKRHEVMEYAIKAYPDP